MEEKTCGKCKYFTQHYIRQADGTFKTISTGQCNIVNLKLRKSDYFACEGFVEAKNNIVI